MHVPTIYASFIDRQVFFCYSNEVFSCISLNTASGFFVALLQKGSDLNLHKLRHYLVIFLIIGLILFTIITLPAFARNYYFQHDFIIEVGGLIKVEREVGDPCITGAYQYQTIEGYANLSRIGSIKMAPYIMNIDEKLDWTVPEGAIDGLVVTTTLELCHRPLSVASANYLPIIAPTMIYLHPDSIVLVEPFFFPSQQIIDPAAPLYKYLIEQGILEDNTEEERIYEHLGYQIEEGDIVNPYNPLVIYEQVGIRGLTSQVWAIQIATDPGHTGALHNDLIAAYGPGPYEALGVDGRGITWESTRTTPELRIYIDEKYRWWYHGGYHPDAEIRTGDEYVGNYFEIEQYANTTSGEMKRFISISSPFSYALLEENMEVVGAAEVREAFRMDNIEPGPNAVTFIWWDVF